MVHPSPLPPEELKRLQLEAAVVTQVVSQVKPLPPRRTRLERWLPLFSNGLLIALVTFVLTYCAVPRFQRDMESRKQQTELTEKYIESLLAYEALLGQQLSVLTPLVLSSEIEEKKIYLDYLEKLQKLQRESDSVFVKAKALELALQSRQNTTVVAQENRASGWKPDAKGNRVDSRESELETLHKAFKETEKDIESWLTNMWCVPASNVKRKSSPCATPDMAFLPRQRYEKLQVGVKTTVDQTEKVIAGVNKKPGEGGTAP